MYRAPVVGTGIVTPFRALLSFAAVIQRNSFTFVLNDEQQAALTRLLKTGNYRPLSMEHTLVAAQGRDCTIALYKSGKCLVQGKGAEEWVTFVLEPQILGEVYVGYEELHHPEFAQPHMGIDESGKGDFFGPLVIAAAFVDAERSRSLRSIDVRDSKRITSDKRAEEMAKSVRGILGEQHAVITIGPEAYNRLYASMRNVNRILSWGHARAIENLLEKVPDCPRAVSDQFGPKRQIEEALMKKGRNIRLEQRPRAESDPAVAAASILARAAFVRALRRMGKQYELAIPKGASAKTEEIARALVEREGPQILLQTSKCHFKTADKVLSAAGFDRDALGPAGAATSKARFSNEQE